MRTSAFVHHVVGGAFSEFDTLFGRVKVQIDESSNSRPIDDEIVGDDTSFKGGERTVGIHFAFDVKPTRKLREAEIVRCTLERRKIEIDTNRAGIEAALKWKGKVRAAKVDLPVVHAERE